MTDRLAGAVTDGWSGSEWGADRNPQGLYTEGPQPARNPLGRLIGVTISPEQPLPAGVARNFLGRVERMATARARKARRGGRLAPLVVGRRR